VGQVAVLEGEPAVLGPRRSARRSQPTATEDAPWKSR
jgi:hypothetical protein